ncbi:MAG: SDR family NAD(P)-dependent oxidoreductase, partial [Spirochaetia bacterium]|nr:SDR family NAD(P)-dependent oxidoreductase [Spirochaetia bacterium]
FGCARHFIAKGYHVFGSVRKKSDADSVKSQLGPEFTPLLFDVADRPAIDAAVKVVEAAVQGKGLGGLINNAGIAEGGPLMHIPIETVRKQFEVNVFGLLQVTQAFLPLLGAVKNHPTAPGRILNISSVAGKMAGPFLGPYVGSKHAVEGISHTLRRELQGYGIDVIIIGPGPVVTPIWEKERDANAYDHTDFAVPVKNFAAYMKQQGMTGLTIDEVGEAVVKIFMKKNPKTRYALLKGKFQNWTLPRLLPDRWIDRMIGKGTGLLER